MSIHGRIYSNHSSTNHGTILQFYCDSFTIQLLKELDQLHLVLFSIVVVKQADGEDVDMLDAA